MTAGAPAPGKPGKAAKAAKGTRIGVQIRGEVTEEYEARGKAKSDLGLVYAPKADEDVSILGLTHYEHYLHSEIDPTIKVVHHAPRKRIEQLAGLQAAKLFHAQVTMHDGRVFWRRLISNDIDARAELVEEFAATVGKGVLVGIAGVQTLSSYELTANPLRIRNSLAVIGWLSGARKWPLAQYREEIFKLARKTGRITFEEALALEKGPKQALTGAAVLQLACSGAFGSDLFEVPLHAMSTFTVRKD